jgi:hypothetical protein
MKRIRFQTAIQPTDRLTLEWTKGDGFWYPFESNASLGSGGFVIQGGVSYGAWLGSKVSATDMEVGFSRYAVPGATYAGVGAGWNVANAAWRVRKVSGGAQVGFPISSANIYDLSSNAIMLTGTQTAAGAKTFSGLVTAGAGVNAVGLFSIGVDYTFGDYSGVQGIKNPASMLILVAGNDVTGAGISALYIVNLRVQSGNISTSATKIAGDAAVTATFTYIATDILRVTYTGSGSVTKWRYLGGF